MQKKRRAPHCALTTQSRYFFSFCWFSHSRLIICAFIPLIFPFNVNLILYDYRSGMVLKFLLQLLVLLVAHDGLHSLNVSIATMRNVFIWFAI